MVLGNVDYMSFMYKNPIYLHYLRLNPHWYKVLYYEPSRMKDFLKEAQKNLKLTTQDKIESLNKKLSFIQGLSSMFK